MPRVVVDGRVDANSYVENGFYYFISATNVPTNYFAVLVMNFRNSGTDIAMLGLSVETGDFYTRIRNGSGFGNWIKR